MDHTQVKEQIVRLLEDIVSRTNHINARYSGPELFMEIDLVKDDMRLLYRQFELLKAASDQEGEIPGNNRKSTLHTQPVSRTMVDPGPGSDRPHTGIRQGETRGGKQEADKGKEEKLPEEELSAPTPKQAPVVETEARTPPPQEKNLSEAAGTKAESIGIEAGEPAPRQPAPQPPVPEIKARSAFSDQPPPPATGKKTVIDKLSPEGNKTIGDLFVQDDNSVHQRLSGQKTDRSIGARMQQHPISSLKDAIGANEKFLFINELFDGDIQAYHDAIARLNEAADVKAAFDTLNALGREFSWDAGRSSATIEMLANFVQRRYMGS